MSGEIAFAADDPSCVAFLGHPCSILVKHLRLQPSSATIPTTQGDIALEAPVLSVQAPLNLINSGSGYVLPASTNVQTCASVGGRADSALAPLANAAEMIIDFTNQLFSFDGTLPLRFHAGDVDCKEITGTLNVVSTGRSPWKRP